MYIANGVAVRLSIRRGKATEVYRVGYGGVEGRLYRRRGKAMEV